MPPRFYSTPTVNPHTTRARILRFSQAIYFALQALRREAKTSLTFMETTYDNPSYLKSCNHLRGVRSGYNDIRFDDIDLTRVNACGDCKLPYGPYYCLNKQANSEPKAVCAYGTISGFGRAAHRRLCGLEKCFEK